MLGFYCHLCTYCGYFPSLSVQKHIFRRLELVPSCTHNNHSCIQWLTQGSKENFSTGATVTNYNQTEILTIPNSTKEKN